MTEDRKHQLDELSISDILSYLGARASDMEEHVRRTDKQLVKARKLLARFVMANVHFDGKGVDLIGEAEQFLQERSIGDEEELKQFLALWENTVCTIRAENKACIDGSHSEYIAHLCDKLESSMVAYAKGDVEYAHFSI